MRKRLLATFLALCMVLGMLPGIARAAETSGKCGDNLTWSYNNGTLTIQGTGSMKNYSMNGSPWHDYSKQIHIINIASGVTSIGTWAFEDCESLTSVTIPDSVTSIGWCAFWGCSSLTSVAIPNGVTSIESEVFRRCSSLTSVTIPNSVTSIGLRAFYECRSLASVTIPNSVTNIDIGGNPFGACNKLTSINVTSGNPAYVSIDGILFNASQTLLLTYPAGKSGSFYRVPDSVRSIGVAAFIGCDGLTSVTIPEGVTSIGDHAFSSCSSLTSVTIPNSVTSIGNWAFGQCKSLTSVTIPSSVTDIEYCAFYECSSLTSVTLPSSVTSIGDSAFWGCRSLTDIYYNGTKAQWAAISKGINNDDLLNANIHFADTIQKHTLSYDLNGGTGSVPAAQEYEVGEMVKLTTVVPTRSGYRFVGWAYNSAGYFYRSGATISMPDYDLKLVAKWEKGAGINDSNVFIKQQTGYTCTLASATMMLRRRAILDDLSNWNTITENTVKSVAVTSDGRLNWDFTYRGMRVETQGLKSAKITTLDQKKDYFISMLAQHPEGIVIFHHNTNPTHAVLLCDYDPLTKTFYCADPAPEGPSGRVPLDKSTIYINGSTQDSKINAINQIWYISNNSNKKILTSTSLAVHCPVDVRISIGDEVLDSRTITDGGTNDFATMVVTGSGVDQNVEVTIQGDYSVSEGIALEFFGTDTGSMTFMVKHTYSDGTTETHTFENVPVTATTVGSADGFYPQSTVLLTMTDTENPDNFTYWTADPDEVATEPSTDFEVFPEDDTSSDIPDTPSTPTYPTYPSGSSGSNSSSTPSYQVTVPTVSNGTVTVTPKSAKSGDKVTITAIPNDGYTIDSVTVTDSNGKSISITDNGDNTYTFTMPSSKVTVNVTFVQVQVEQPPVEPVETPWVNPFPDVSKNDWFYDDVAYVAQNGLMCSMDNGQFNPNGTTTRGMLMTILARLEGIDTSSSNPWYQTGMEWAMRTGVSDGSNPEGSITREELATMLWRYAGEPAVTGDLSSYPDTGNVHDWASSAMAWAVQNGIINGMDGKLNPQGNAIRAQVAAMLTRFCKNVVK